MARCGLLGFETRYRRHSRAAPGDFLVDTASQVFQSIAKGRYADLYNEGQATVVPAGTYEKAAYLFRRNVAQFFQPDDDGNLLHGAATTARQFQRQNISEHLSDVYDIGGGVLFLNVTFRFANGGTGSASVSFNHRAAWTVFRGQF